MRCLVSIITLLGFAVSTGCAPASQLQPYYRTPTAGQVLTQRELATVVGMQTTYSAVEHLRPLFLTTRPAPETLLGAPPRVHVFINGSLAGDVDVLKMIPLRSVESIERVPAPFALTLFGRVGAGDTVLMVQLR